VWSLVGGFSVNYQMLIACRSLQALGSAAFLPSSMALMGSIYRPGPRKNLVFGLYGAFATLGFFFGILLGGFSGTFLSWRWYFWIGAFVTSVIIVASLATIPRKSRQTASRASRKMDWWGVGTIVPGLLLLVYSLTDATNAPGGFASPRICLTFVIGVIMLGLAVRVEGWVSSDPLLPFDLFKVRYMKPMSISLFLSYGAFGIYLFYASF
jgi:MFS family permease